MKDFFVLGIETSCDETSAAVVKNGRDVLSNVISSQIDLHKEYGGVVPEIASRRHVELILPVIEESLRVAGIGKDELGAIAVTYGPGLVGALLVGVSVAKGLSFGLKKPLVGVHHIEGHIASNYLNHQELEPPFLCLIVSGGHSHIVKVCDYDQFEILGKTRDDAAGEAFDKVARVLGLGYPGGPKVDALAKEGNPEAISFPKTYFGEGNYDFSFSGIKTAVMNYVNNTRSKNQEINLPNVCASFQQSVIEVLATNSLKALSNQKMDTLALAGGVASNSGLRHGLEKRTKKEGFKLFYPSPILCTDNAAMIACAGYYNYIKGHISDLGLNAVPNLKIGSR
jgi:N6-L-threonylcarbamoyladenine synthase